MARSEKAWSIESKDGGQQDRGQRTEGSRTTRGWGDTERRGLRIAECGFRIADCELRERRTVQGAGLKEDLSDRKQSLLLQRIVKLKLHAES
jgi:hypothetical protein